MLKMIIAGGRDFNDYGLLLDYMNLLEPDLAFFNGAEQTGLEIVSGACRGADALGERFAREFDLQITQFPADWAAYGKSAGPRRNRLMADYADVLVAFWDGKSRGTKHMIDTAREAGLEVHVFEY